MTLGRRKRLLCGGALPRLWAGSRPAWASAGGGGTVVAIETDFAGVARRALGRCPGDVVGVLQGIQAECGYLPGPALAEVAAQTGRSLAQLYGVISFYATFSLEKRGRVVIRVCQGTACHVRGAQRVTEALTQHLHIDPGQTTEDYEFTLETVACLGCCSLAPVLTVAGHTHGRSDGPRAVASLVQQHDHEEESW